MHPRLAGTADNAVCTLPVPSPLPGQMPEQGDELAANVCMCYFQATTYCSAHHLLFRLHRLHTAEL